jgi:unsaturated rhamnogalacturonyl hydrolase
MNIKLLVVLVALSMILCQNVFAQEPYSQWMARSQMKRSGTISSWDYPNGLFVESVLKVYGLYQGQEFLAYVQNHAHATIPASTGKIGTRYNFTEFNIDYVNPGMFLFGLNQIDPKNQYKIALDTLRKQLQQQPRINNTVDGGFWHKLVYPHQMWLDGLFMGTRYYVSYEKAFSANPNYDDIVNQFTTIHAKTYDPEFQLNYHAWSAQPNDANSFWANKSEPFLGCSKEFWGRGMGWYAAALVDVIDVLPAQYVRRKELIDIFKQVAAGIKRWQDTSSGCWYQLLRYNNTFKSAKGNVNYIEASASSMFTYALLKAVRLGIVEQEVYKPVSVKAYNGLISNFITSDASNNISLNRICQSAGLGPASNPTRDGSASYYLDGSDAGKIVSNDLKGVGPFIMASVEYEMMVKGETGTSGQLDEKPRFSFSKRQSQLLIESDCRIEHVSVYNVQGKKLCSISGNQADHLLLPLIDYTGMLIFLINNRYTTKYLIGN